MSESPFEPHSVVDESPQVSAVAQILDLDDSRRIVPAGEALYRFAWELHYRSGAVRRQYERLGEHIVQSLFSRVSPEDVRGIHVWDLEKSGQAALLMRIGLPHEAYADVLYNCSFETNDQTIRRIYTFGWYVPGTEARQYFHVNPKDPSRIAVSTQRLL